MIIRRKHNKNFTIIPNGIWDDEALTIEAKGALGYLLSRPNDWNVHLGALGRKLGLGKNKTQALVRQLISAGYMVRLKQKRIGPQQFAKCEYVVFDAPETRAEFMTEKGLEEVRIVPLSAPENSNQHEPQPQNGATVIPLEKRCDISVAALVTVAPNQGRILRTDLTNTLREKNSASNDAGASAPSVSKTVWKEGRELLQQSSSQANPSIIGKWLKRTPSDNDKQTLLQIFRAARNAGSGDPVAYVTRVVNDKFPLPADPKAFADRTWERNIKAAIKTRGWAPEWGPAPGGPGCLVPPGLITRDLLTALQIHEVAA